MNKILTIIKRLSRGEVQRIGATLFWMGVVGVLAVLIYINVSNNLRDIELFLIKFYLDVSVLNLPCKIIIAFALISALGVLIHFSAYEPDIKITEDTDILK